MSRIVLVDAEGQEYHHPESTDAKFEHHARTIGARLVLRISTTLVVTLFDRFPDSADGVQVGASQVQIIESLAHLDIARKHQNAAFVREERCLVVWAEGIEKLMERAAQFNDALFSAIWDDKNVLVQESDELERVTAQLTTRALPAPKKPRPAWLGGKKNLHVSQTELSSPTNDQGEETQSEKGREKKSNEGSWEDIEPATELPRIRLLQQPTVVAITWILLGLVFGLCLKAIVGQYLMDGKYIHFLFVLVFPNTFLFAMFAFQTVVGNTAQLFGPVSTLRVNTMFYSAVPPKRISTEDPLPHFTIQMPVYKESLGGVIDPTIQSLLLAISTYELQGGSANIFVNDDGIQLLDEDHRKLRMRYYEMHGIGWVARPGHNVDGFQRMGKFKKASNMNFALDISRKCELLLETPQFACIDDEDEAYEQALDHVLAENPRAWAAGNIRIGDYILIIDSDTRIPGDCLLDAASEMEASPDVAILQQSSGVMKVVNNYWEDGIAYFTELVYRAIRFACATGDVAAFVGHNAILRWSAIQEIAYEQDVNGIPTLKYWSEAHVSEDFEMSMKLQILGYRTRLAAYNGDGFKEGVSLTVYDELTRWEKYAYGCSELMFHPFRYWPTRGPFTPLFRRFVGSNMKGHSKFTIMAYIGTYYSIAGAWLITLVNYFATGWFLVYLDGAYLQSWSVWLFCIALFTVVSGIVFVIYRYRIREQELKASLIEVLKWTPLMIVFFSGLSIHVSQAIMYHLCGIEMTWGATAKELADSNFWKEVPMIIKKFKVMYLFIIGLAVGMICIAYVVPAPWRIGIGQIYAWVPLANIVVGHALFPLILNPQLMHFSF